MVNLLPCRVCEQEPALLHFDMAQSYLVFTSLQETLLMLTLPYWLSE